MPALHHSKLSTTRILYTLGANDYLDLSDDHSLNKISSEANKAISKIVIIDAQLARLNTELPNIQAKLTKTEDNINQLVDKRPPIPRTVLEMYKEKHSALIAQAAENDSALATAAKDRQAYILLFRKNLSDRLPELYHNSSTSLSSDKIEQVFREASHACNTFKNTLDEHLKVRKKIEQEIDVLSRQVLASTGQNTEAPRLEQR